MRSKLIVERFSNMYCIRLNKVKGDNVQIQFITKIPDKQMPKCMKTKCGVPYLIFHVHLITQFSVQPLLGFTGFKHKQPTCDVRMSSEVFHVSFIALEKETLHCTYHFIRFAMFPCFYSRFSAQKPLCGHYQQKFWLSTQLHASIHCIFTFITPTCSTSGIVYFLIDF